MVKVWNVAPYMHADAKLQVWSWSCQQPGIVSTCSFGSPVSVRKCYPMTSRTYEKKETRDVKRNSFPLRREGRDGGLGPLASLPWCSSFCFRPFNTSGKGLASVETVGAEHITRNDSIKKNIKALRTDRSDSREGLALSSAESDAKEHATASLSVPVATTTILNDCQHNTDDIACSSLSFDVNNDQSSMMKPSGEHSGMQIDVFQPSLVVFSGGTAFNSVAAHVRHLTTRVTHVLPVSDDGGSTAEIVRVLGGPAVGDIRSRCLRLADDSDEEARAVRRLLAYRLSGSCSEEAKRDWYDIIEGNHPLWSDVSEPYKHTIRAFLIHFHVNILRHSTERFNFKSGSVGNFFFAGARIFFRSLEAAIFLFSRVARIPEGSLVLPAVCTEERLSLAAVLSDGTVLVGQNQISHPSAPCSLTGTVSPHQVDKSNWEPLDSPIERVFYLSSEGDGREHEVAPTANPRVLNELQRSDAVVYGMGSLYTSICPSLILKGVGEEIASRNCPKVVILNGGIDREISSCKAHEGCMAASDVVLALTDALNRHGALPGKSEQLSYAPDAYVTAVIVPEGGPIAVDEDALHKLGVKKVINVASVHLGQCEVVYNPEALVEAIGSLVEQST